jgi:hypothetical protein
MREQMRVVEIPSTKSASLYTPIFNLWSEWGGDQEQRPSDPTMPNDAPNKGQFALFYEFLWSFCSFSLEPSQDLTEAAK